MSVSMNPIVQEYDSAPSSTSLKNKKNSIEIAVTDKNLDEFVWKLGWEERRRDNWCPIQDTR